MGLKKHDDEFFEEFNTDENEEVDYDDTTHSSPAKLVAAYPIVKSNAPPPEEVMTPIEYVISNCTDVKHVQFLEREEVSHDAIRNFILSSMIAPWTGRGFAGLVETGNSKGLIAHVVDINNSYYNGSRLEFVANLGSLSPFPLMELHQAVDFIKEKEPETYAEYRSQGMISPGHVLDYLIGHKSFTLVASVDIVSIMEVANIRAARYLLNSLVASGCTALLTYSDLDMLNFLKRKDFFKRVRCFALGEY